MTLISKIKVIALSVLIVAGAAVSSDAKDQPITILDVARQASIDLIEGAGDVLTRIMQHSRAVVDVITDL